MGSAGNRTVYFPARGGHNNVLTIDLIAAILLQNKVIILNACMQIRSFRSDCIGLIVQGLQASRCLKFLDFNSDDIQFVI